MNRFIYLSPKAESTWDKEHHLLPALLLAQC